MSKSDSTIVTSMNGNEISKHEFLLNLLLQKFSDLNRNKEPKERKESALEVGDLAVEYLKKTDQFRDQFNLCLKTFDGSDSSSFDSDFQNSIKELYKDHVARLGDEILSFSFENIHSDNFREYNFKSVYVITFKELFQEYFVRYVETVDEHFGKDPFDVQRLRLKTASKTTFKTLEGKLRTIGQFAAIEEAISFIKIRIGLHKDKKYVHKILVEDLDELINKMLINTSTNEINKVKAQEETKDLVKEGMRRFEVLNRPKYIVDDNLYRTALTKKIDGVLNRSK